MRLVTFEDAVGTRIGALTKDGHHRQWFLGKSLDGFCPMGPGIVTAEEIGDVGSLGLITRANGEVRQDAMVSDLIFDVPTLIATLSRARFLSKGDTVSVIIDPIGTLSNPVE